MDGPLPALVPRCIELCFPHLSQPAKAVCDCLTGRRNQCSGTKPSDEPLSDQPMSNGLQPNSDGLQPNTVAMELQPKSDGLQHEVSSRESKKDQEGLESFSGKLTNSGMLSVGRPANSWFTSLTSLQSLKLEDSHL